MLFITLLFNVKLWQLTSPGKVFCGRSFALWGKVPAKKTPRVPSWQYFTSQFALQYKNEFMLSVWSTEWYIISLPPPKIVRSGTRVLAEIQHPLQRSEPCVLLPRPRGVRSKQTFNKALIKAVSSKEGWKLDVWDFRAV